MSTRTMLLLAALLALPAAAGGASGQPWAGSPALGRPSPPPVPPEGLCTSLGVTRQAMLGHEDSVNCLEMMPNRPLLISGSDDGSARMWDLRTLECVLGFEARIAPGAPAGAVTSLAGTARPPATHTVLSARALGPRTLIHACAHPTLPLQCRRSASTCCMRRRGPRFCCSTSGCPPCSTRSWSWCKNKARLSLSLSHACEGDCACICLCLLCLPCL